jgi:hypothetical protein
MITPYPTLGKPKAKVLVDAFMAGCGDLKQDAAVFYGVNDTNIDHWRRVQRMGTPYYSIDNSYFDETRGFKEPHAQFRITKNRFQVQAQGMASDGRRFAVLGVQLQPWKVRGPDSHIVLCQQSDEFMQDVAKYPGNWLRGATTATRWEHPHHAVVIRTWDRDKAKLARSLPQDLEGAFLLATHSSAAAVTALIHGVPVRVSSMSALWGCNFDRKNDNCPVRLTAMGVLADNQWSLEEIASGKAWSWLNK